MVSSSRCSSTDNLDTPCFAGIIHLTNQFSDNVATLHRLKFASNKLGIFNCISKLYFISIIEDIT